MAITEPANCMQLVLCVSACVRVYKAIPKFSWKYQIMRQGRSCLSHVARAPFQSFISSRLARLRRNPGCAGRTWIDVALAWIRREASRAVPAWCRMAEAKRMGIEATLGRRDQR